MQAEDQNAGLHIKFGTVSAIDAAKHMVTVTLDDEDITTHWLMVSSPFAYSAQKYGIPPVGTPVWCLLDEDCEVGVVGGAHYTDASPPPVSSETKDHIAYPDGTTIEYDWDTHELAASVEGTATLTATGDVSIDTEGNLRGQATGDVSITAGGDASVSAGGSASVEAGGDASVSAGGGVSVEGGTSATLKAPEISLDGAVTVTGALIVQGQLSPSGGFAAGDIEIEGSISATGTIIDSTGNTANHSH